MSLQSGVAVAVGVLLVALLVVKAGPGSVVAAAVAAGWVGVLAVAALHVLAQLVCAAAWWGLCPPARIRPSWLRLTGIRLVRDAMGEVLPTVPLGELAAVRELMRTGLGPVEASALTVADVTVELGGQAAYTLLAFALVAAAHPGAGRLLGVSGVAGSLFIFGGCVWVQRSGGAHLARLCGGAVPLLRDVPDVWQRVRATLWRIYARRRPVALGTALHLLAWFVGGLQSWVLLSLMGVEVSPAAALALEAWMATVHRVAPTPGAIGVQEGGYVLGGAAFGVDEGAMLAVSLNRRARDLLVAVPVILAWQAVQLRRGAPARQSQGT